VNGYSSETAIVRVPPPPPLDDEQQQQQLPAAESPERAPADLPGPQQDKTDHSGTDDTAAHTATAE